MTLKTFLGALALAFAAVPAAAIEQSHDGSGEAVLLPHYSLHRGLSTVFAVTNHSDEPKAVRVVIAEGRNGRVALSYNVYLAARDSWSGAIVSDQGSPPAPPKVFTVDRSCTSAAFLADGVPLRNLAFFGSRNDGLGTDAGRLYTGQIELIELGTLTGSAAQLAEAENCDGLRLRFQPGGAWATDLNADVGTPSGGICGEAQLIDVAGGVAFHTEPFVISGFSKAARHGNGSIDFESARIYKPTSTDANNEFIVSGFGRVAGQRPADAVSLLMMASQLETSFTISEAVDASTHIALSFPTRAAYVDNLPGGELPAGTPPLQPFAFFEPEVPYCVQTTWRSIDRDGDLGLPSEIEHCEQVNEIEIGTAFDAGIDQGRLRIGLHPDRHAITYSVGPQSGNAFAYGLPALAHSLMEVRNSNAQPGVLASYAISGRVVRKRETAIDF